jgi:hypothetical protein
MLTRKPKTINLAEQIHKFGADSLLPDWTPGRIQARRRTRAKPDHGLLGLFIDHLKEDCQWTRIETAMVAQGVPDGNYCFAGGRDGWLETKWTTGWKVRITPEQVSWILKRARLGGRVSIAVWRAVDELWLVDGSQAGELALFGLKGPAGARAVVWRGGVKAWPWDQIRIYLAEGAGWALPK